MNCKEAQAVLQAHVDGELELLKELDLEQHLQTCPACLQLTERLSALQRTLKNSDTLYFKAPAHLQQRIDTALHEASTPRHKSHAPFWRWQISGAALAFVALLAVSLNVFLAAPSQQDILLRELIGGHVRSLMADHLADIVSSDQHTVKPWFNGKLDFSPPVKDLVAQGFPLVGGRLDYLGNRPVAALVYRRHKHFINLFIWPASTDISDTQTRSRQGYHLLHWTQTGLQFWAVSELSEGELTEFARLVRLNTL